MGIISTTTITDRKDALKLVRTIPLDDKGNARADAAPAILLENTDTQCALTVQQGTEMFEYIDEFLKSGFPGGKSGEMVHIKQEIKSGKGGIGLFGPIITYTVAPSRVSFDGDVVGDLSPLRKYVMPGAPGVQNCREL